MENIKIDNIEDKLMANNFNKLRFGMSFESQAKSKVLSDRMQRENVTETGIKKILRRYPLKENQMSVRAKFKVSEITETDQGKAIKLSPVTSGSKENEEFFKWRPYGSITIGTINPAVAEQLTIGKVFYVDFTEAV